MSSEEVAAEKEDEEEGDIQKLKVAKVEEDEDVVEVEVVDEVEDQDKVAVEDEVEDEVADKIKETNRRRVRLLIIFTMSLQCLYSMFLFTLHWIFVNG